MTELHFIPSNVMKTTCQMAKAHVFLHHKSTSGPKQFGHSWELEICRKTLSGVTASNHSHLNHEVFSSFSTCTCLPASNKNSGMEV